MVLLRLPLTWKMLIQLVDFPIVAERKEVKLERVLSNNFGFGGTNASIALAQYQD